MRDLLRVAPEVAQALAAGRAVVALESTVIAHGLPRPTNLETALACERAVRDTGAVPATLALAEGAVVVGADEALLRALATRDDVRKASVRDLAPLLARGELGATTVGGSVAIAALAGIAVLATGGIGGVHRGAERTDDVSADLEAIARHPVCVVCSGAKHILDVPRTLERLETLGVPVLSVGQDEFPAFVVRSSGVRAPYRVDDPREIAALARIRLADGGGMVVALPVPAGVAVDAAAAERALVAALRAAERGAVAGSEVTPFLLGELAAREPATLRANVALLEANARFAARIAAALAAV